MTNLDSILKSRDITLSTKVHLVKAMVFPVVMHGCESCTIKKTECRGTDAFELWCWRRLLRISWTARRSNQSILKEISPGCSLEGPMLKLKLQYFGHLMQRADSLEKNPDAGKDWGQEEKGTTEDEMVGWHHQLNSHGFGWTPGVGDGQGGLVYCGSWGRKEPDTTERLNWTELKWLNWPLLRASLLISAKVAAGFSETKPPPALASPTSYISSDASNVKLQPSHSVKCLIAFWISSNPDSH